MPISESIEILFGDFSDEDESKFNEDTIKWLARLIKSDKVVKPVTKSRADPKWKEVEQKWIKALSPGLSGPSSMAMFRSIGNYSGPTHEILHAKDILAQHSGEATEEIFAVIEDKNTPHVYNNLDQYQETLARIIENKQSITIIDQYLLEVTPAVVKQVLEYSDEEIINAVQNRANQISNLFKGLTKNTSTEKPLRKIVLISVLTKKFKLKDAIEAQEDSELKSKLKNSENIKDATKKVANLILHEVGKQVPELSKLGLRVEIKDLKPAIDDKELIAAPHDRMIVSNNKPEWCATAGFALDVKKNKIVTPQGYFVRFWRTDADKIQTESVPVTHIKYQE